MIALGYVLKRVGFFQPSDYRIVSNIVMNITLPAAVITSFGSLEMETNLVFVILFGLVCNLVLLAAGALISRRRSSSTKALYMINIPGYNIGTFTMPFIQSFLGPYGVAVTSLFDTGNAIMVTGGTFAVTSHALKTGEGVSAKAIVKTLFSSVPFLVYISMLILALARIRIPSGIVAITSPIGAANAFMAMLMIGLMIEIRLDSAALKKAGVILFVRFLFAGVLSLLFYNFTPFTLAVRQVLAIVVFSPVSSLAPVFTERSKGDAALSSFIASLSIVISLVTMTVLILVLKIGQN